MRRAHRRPASPSRSTPPTAPRAPACSPRPTATCPRPTFMPVGTQGSVKTLTPGEVAATGARIVLGNTYHLWLRPGPEVVARAGGLHRFTRWPHAMLTDSGGFQAFSLAERRIFGPDGFVFRSHLDGAKRALSPEVAMAGAGRARRRHRHAARRLPARRSAARRRSRRPAAPRPPGPGAASPPRLPVAGALRHRPGRHPPRSAPRPRRGARRAALRRPRARRLQRGRAHRAHARGARRGRLRARPGPPALPDGRGHAARSARRPSPPASTCSTASSPRATRATGRRSSSAAGSSSSKRATARIPRRSTRRAPARRARAATPAPTSATSIIAGEILVLRLFTAHNLHLYGRLVREARAAIAAGPLRLVRARMGRRRPPHRARVQERGGGPRAPSIVTKRSRCSTGRRPVHSRTGVG